jgi:hypothetical protein
MTIKKIFAKLPKGSKNSKNGTIFATGNLAVALGVNDYDTVDIKTISAVQIQKLSNLLGVTN